MNNSLINCNNVYIKNIIKNDVSMAGAFANINFKKGDIVEYGIVRVITLDGHQNPYVFTWSNDIPNTKWGLSSGCATFYNTSLNPNTYMERDFENNTFIFRAITDIKKDDELTHIYKSLKWRKCFSEINNYLNNN
jgi:hypothetical protein